MRMFPFAVALLPLPAFAEVIAVTAPLTAVTVYARGAVITREVQVDLPAGAHTVRLADMDPALDLNVIDVALAGAQITSRSWRPDGTGPYRAPRTREWLAARAALDAAEDSLAAQNDAIAQALARGQAAQDQIDFLTGIALPDETPADVDTVRAIGQLISSDGTAARAAIAEAEADARRLRRALPDLAFAVEEAKAALDDATPTNAAPATLDLDVNVPQSTNASLTIRYVTQAAQWAPVYTLTLEDDETLRIDRGATIGQFTQEDWRDVALTLSTLSPFQGSEPGTLWPLLRRIEDPTEALRGVNLQSRLSVDGADTIAPGPVVEEATAAANYIGVGVSYTLSGTVSVPARQEQLRIALDTLEVDATLSARAVPRLNETAFRQVSYNNTTPEILLPGQAVLYVDDQLVGTTRMSMLPPNADADIFFGPIEGLRLERTVLDRNEGDRGLITRSNEQREAIRLEIENLTGRDWPVALRESVPYSEQEDLVIDWTATPPPDVEAVDERRGILEWQLELAPGQTQLIEVETTITWPEDKVLR